MKFIRRRMPFGSGEPLYILYLCSSTEPLILFLVWAVLIASVMNGNSSLCRKTQKLLIDGWQATRRRAVPPVYPKTDLRPVFSPPNPSVEGRCPLGGISRIKWEEISTAGREGWEPKSGRGLVEGRYLLGGALKIEMGGVMLGYLLMCGIFHCINYEIDLIITRYSSPKNALFLAICIH